jgi:predicted permease
VEASAVLRPLAVIAVATLKQIGAMGVPLALVAVGAALRFEFVRGHLWLMAACTAAKLIVMPLATLLVCRALFPAMPPAALGTSVLMMGSPLSVGVYVISREMDAESDFIAGVLVMSTVAAVVTVPAWLAVLMHGG